MPARNLLVAMALATSTTCFAQTQPATLSPADTAARKAHELVEQNKLSEALPLLDQALEGNPNHARAAFDRAMIRYVQGDLAGALADIEHAARLTPQDSRVVGAQCVIRVANGQAEKGAEACRSALPNQTTIPVVNALISRGQASLLLNADREALADFDAALRLEPRAVRALYGRGVARKKLGDAAGQADMDEAVRRLPGAGREYPNARS
ncbi:tetratricopeptide repeat protein [Uliginosibacterium sp. H1]|uniref:tetratricopeptide repeat protein n=1 Tax=Uliginosibacterium sp. H1 TaxID=3114757 RepID=UPI002E176D56|nr:tetratricopeptide repeat protein [Uliginosibacterium sp. H1]